MRPGARLGFLLAPCAFLLAAARPARAQPADEPPGNGPTPSGTVVVTPEYRWLFGIPVLGGEVTGAFGLNDRLKKPLQVEVAVNGFFGQTRAGLPLVRVSVGAVFDGRYGGFHFGGLLGLGYVTLRRADGSEWMDSAVATTDFFFGPELVLTPGLVVSVDATLAVDMIEGGRTVDLWGPGIGLRARVF
jgi:hypothetical protein